ncbi:hypothetical protein HPB50_023748 [Hyalomma asiaticum]|uniref:Uncharacterized protein n=1 Tax=Hyalomma asiaticum TaxID=266040 RepID=A0ACB7T316_HYAAI|nr:hypothetical protein HPB50_023748 [Hyalomma asiaticum]
MAPATTPLKHISVKFPKTESSTVVISDSQSKEASCFNRLPRGFCSHSRNVFFLDHGFQHLPPGRVLAADGLHPCFEAVAVMTSHIRELCYKRADNKVSLWCEFALLRGGATLNPLQTPQTTPQFLAVRTFVRKVHRLLRPVGSPLPFPKEARSRQRYQLTTSPW